MSTIYMYIQTIYLPDITTMYILYIYINHGCTINQYIDHVYLTYIHKPHMKTYIHINHICIYIYIYIHLLTLCLLA